MGWNLEGAIKQSDKSYIKELESRIAELENTKQRKSKKKYNFDKILGNPIQKKDLPWEF